MQGVFSLLGVFPQAAHRSGRTAAHRLLSGAGRAARARMGGGGGGGHLVDHHGEHRILRLGMRQRCAQRMGSVSHHGQRQPPWTASATTGRGVTCRRRRTAPLCSGWGEGRAAAARRGSAGARRGGGRQAEARLRGPCRRAGWRGRRSRWSPRFPRDSPASTWHPRGARPASTRHTAGRAEGRNALAAAFPRARGRLLLQACHKQLAGGGRGLDRTPLLQAADGGNAGMVQTAWRALKRTEQRMSCATEINIWHVACEGGVAYRLRRRRCHVAAERRE